MMEERIVISDANILFDLMSVDLLTPFFDLPWEVHTTDLVLAEITNPEQLASIEKFQKERKLNVVVFELSEMFKISALFKSCGNNASMPDCSVWYYAKKVDGRLLTGDRKLRSVAEKDSVRVSGILYIFDRMVENYVLPCALAAEKLESLMKKNGRLPKEECESRIENWLKEYNDFHSA